MAGAVYLENRKATGLFTEETERLIVEFAETVGAALRNAEAFEDLRLSRDALRAAVTRAHGFEGIEGRDRIPRTAEAVPRRRKATSRSSSKGRAAPARN